MATPSNVEPSSLTAGHLGSIEYRPIGSLVVYERNARRHPEDQIGKLMNSISEFGFALPVLIDRHGTIIAGHARVEAAQRLGMQEVPTLTASDWSDAQVRAFRIADNRLAELAVWDDDLLALELSSIIEIGELSIELLGWDGAEIDLPQSGAVDGADAVAQPTPVTRVGDTWLLGSHRLFCGAFRDGEAVHIDDIVQRWGAMTGKPAILEETSEPYQVARRRRANEPAVQIRG